MKFTTLVLALLGFTFMYAQSQGNPRSGNPIFPGWYADPEGSFFNKEYWIYPTYSAVFDKQKSKTVTRGL